MVCRGGWGPGREVVRPQVGFVDCGRGDVIDYRRGGGKRAWMRFRARLLALGLLVFVAGPVARAGGQAPNVRIGLVRGIESVSFSGPAGVTMDVLRGEREVATAGPGEVWEVGGERGRARLADPSGERTWSVRRGFRLTPPEGEVVRVYGVEGHWDGVMDRDYRGAIEVRRGGRGRLVVVNVVDVETYLRGVVASEMPTRYPLEALKAQAVAARGQALMKAGRHRREGFDLCSGQHCQVYGGATSEDGRTDAAVSETRGEVLMYNRRLADTLYSSNCGGHTANNEDYWPGQRPVPYLRGRPDFDAEELGVELPLGEEELKQFLKYAPPVNCNQPWYGRSSAIRWWSVAPREEVAEALREEAGDFGELLDVRVTERGESGIAREVMAVGSRRLVRVRGGGAIRRALGGVNSAFVAVEPVKGEGEFPAAFVIWGAGWGHQVGMCQMGAAGLAGRGWDYREVLAKYYPGCEVVRRY